MSNAVISGVDCKIHNFWCDVHGRLWVDVKCEYYARPLPLLAEYIEVLDDENENDDNA